MTILAVATDREVVEIWDDQDWVEVWDFSTEDNDGVQTPEDFTSCSVVGALVGETGRIDLTSADDSVTIEDNVVTVSVPRAAVRDLAEGFYEFGLTKVGPAGEEGLLRGRRQLVRGVRP